jgi:tetratricopeptide (TPR) repeat protein
MKSVRLAMLTAAAAALTAGCHEGRPESASPAMAPQSATGQMAPAPAETGPPNEYRHALLRDAMRGLRYDSGRVEIDPETAQAVIQGEDRKEAPAEFERGRELLDHNQVIAAIKAHTKAVLLDPEEPEFYEGLGLALMAKRKPSKAAAAFRTALDLAPDSVSARFHLSEALNWLGQLDEAIHELREVLARDPDYAEAQSRLAIALYYAGQDKEAWEHVHRAEELGQEVPPQFRALLARRTPEPPTAGQ